MILLHILLESAAVLVLVPVSILFCEVLLAVIPATRSTAVTPGDRRRVAIVMPAHNEGSIIARSLRSILPQLHACDRLLVVADNCSDDTAAVAMSEGAETVVRADSLRRGKGYALDFGIQHLYPDPPDIVIIIDADCRVAPGAIERLAKACGCQMHPVQALYLMRSRDGAGLKMRVAEFAWIVKNKVRPLGLQRLRLPCQLMGTGMAFPWESIKGAKLATGHIVEDLKLGLDLARAGTPALFCSDAVVMSDFPESDEGIQAQRTRWEHGHLAVIVADAPRLLFHAIVSSNRALLALILDLAIPPLALLALGTSVVWIASALLWLFTGAELAFCLATIAIVLLGVSVMLCWACHGRQIISFGSLILAPAYVVWKIPLYFRFLLARQMEWVRSKRGN